MVKEFTLRAALRFMMLVFAMVAAVPLAVAAGSRLDRILAEARVRVCI